MTVQRATTLASVRAGLVKSLAVLVIVMLTIPRVFGHDPSPYLKIAAALGAALAILAWRGHGERFVPWPAAALVVVAGASVLWSVDQRVTAELAAITALVTALAATFARAVPARSRPRYVTGALVVVVGGSSLWAMADGPWAFTYDWRGTPLFQGLYRNWNITGYTLALLLPAVLALRPRTWTGRALQVVGIVGSLAVLRATHSATSFITGLVLTCIMLVLLGIGIAQQRLRVGHEHRLWRRVVGAGLLCTVAAAAVFVKVTGSLDKSVSTLSGRTDLWRGVAEVSAQVPVGGFGWGTVWRYHWFLQPVNERSKEINEHVPWPLAHGHSTVFDVLPQLGIVGVVVVVALLVIVSWRALNAVVRGADEVSTWAFLSVVALLILGVTEPILSIPLGWFLLCLVLATLAPARSRALPGRHASPLGPRRFKDASSATPGTTPAGRDGAQPKGTRQQARRGAPAAAPTTDDDEARS